LVGAGKPDTAIEGTYAMVEAREFKLWSADFSGDGLVNKF